MSPNLDAINRVSDISTVLILFPFKHCVNAGKKSGQVGNFYGTFYVTALDW
jgi:hypothetical protein